MINKYTLILAAICLILGGLWYNSLQKLERAEAANSGLVKNLKIERDENGRNRTTINQLTISRNELLDLKTSEPALQRLQAAVKKDRNIVAASVFTAITEGKASGATDPVLSVVPQTTKPQKDSIKLIGKVKARGFEATVEATVDSVRLTDYKIYSDYTITQTSASGGFLKPRIQIVTVTPEDPNSSVIDARSFTVTPKKGRTGLKIGIGVGVGLLVGKAIFK